ncbi:RNA-binding protein 1-like isoform X1 [Salvia splendens]|uniref:RNA-binding protein 1-like isoform X1 n=2 Tax=Salvia splendens TaxID=180675 RepID=UPI001C27DB97|nr:RNA-binding protein 1-like isoform X1 [Salvia splendens]XP_042066238.1 RNA-binding protein 1-like isoform X1 [Salvia splendens]XP_042066239.1 RNA-binding protein 1-like isoform X1 [Salvia splendens]XP_042066240.1 RNA-binding protein 1-like isoform X1 [Salvia splendens]
MADAYWRYGDGRQQPAALPPHVVKRPRTDSDMPSGPDMSGYYGRDEDRAGLRVIRDTDTMNATYDRYLRNVQMPSYASESGRSMSSGLGGHHHVDDPRALGIVRPNPAAAAAAAKNRSLGVGGRPEIPLPPDASSTLFVEGLPANCTRREVSHIFRPFVGYKEVRLVTKESRHSGGDPLVLCFVDFQSPAHAATAMDAIQGYNFDEHDRDSTHLRLQFARFPGARSRGGHRGKRD